MDAFQRLEDLGEVAFDVRSRGVGLEDQTGFLEQFVARWTSRRTETPSPIGIAWISAVAFMSGKGPHLVSGCLNRSLLRRGQAANPGCRMGVKLRLAG